MKIWYHDGMQRVPKFARPAHDGTSSQATRFLSFDYAHVVVEADAEDEVFFVPWNDAYRCDYLPIQGLSGLPYDHDNREQYPEGLRSDSWSTQPLANQELPEIAVPVQKGSKHKISAYTSQTFIVPANEVVELEVEHTPIGELEPELHAVVEQSRLCEYVLGERYPHESTPEMQSRGRELLASANKALGIGCVSPWYTLVLASQVDTVGCETFSDDYVCVSMYATLTKWCGEIGGEIDYKKLRAELKAIANKFPYSKILYHIIDEPKPELMPWANEVAKQIKGIDGIFTMVTATLPEAATFLPNVDVIAWTPWPKHLEQQRKAVEIIRGRGQQIFGYNGKRPAGGSMALECPPADLRMIPWMMALLDIKVWFWWNSTNWYNELLGWKKTDVLKDPYTFGPERYEDYRIGRFNRHGCYGDGVLGYPLDGIVVPSVRLFAIRAGFVDGCLISEARKVDEKATMQIVSGLVGNCGWLLKDTNPNDTSYNLEPVPWPESGKLFYNARNELLSIVDRQQEDEIKEDSASDILNRISADIAKLAKLL
jgi:hypothetical protein